MAIKFYYGGVRARGSVMRYVLDHAEADWEEIEVWEDKCKFVFEKAKWQEKYGKFVTTPLIEDKDTEISCTATAPILLYLGEKFEYFGKNQQEKYQILAAVDKITALREAFLYGFFPNASPPKTEDHLKVFEQQLTDHATKFLFDNEKLSIADFYLFSLLVTLQDWKPDLLDKFPKIAEFIENMLLDDKVKKRYDKEKQIPWVSAGNFTTYFGKIATGKEIKIEDCGKVYAWGYDMDHMKPAF